MLFPGQICVDTDSCRVTYQDETVDLYPKQYQLLLLFLKHPNYILSYDFIINRLWDMDHIPTYSSIRTHIKSIRKAFKKVKYSEEIIENVYGMGYRLNPVINNKIREHNSPIPSVSGFQNLLSFKGIEYLVIDDQLIIQYLSPNLIYYCDYPQHLQVGVYAGNPFPQLIGLEEVFDKIRKKEDKTFTIKRIARNCYPTRPECINLYVIVDKVEDIGDLGKQLVLVFFEDASEQMIYSNCQGG
ncbi:winged helix-turn-helix domain-containing protein [Planktothrix agardhii]|jgi:DNA-binding winged helix-turn-helix (wHTH) protein|uniref:winged helix-turn-helix domain-containing protein n=1 Tax=Planktothrix agardhii TaxID=1160 RepID=UPI000DBB95EC|nr:winged helix-turn-helix domain-containing protein [Planktothrix agardhii]MCF3607264.1 winged helix-turn-helix domain-containing protein [Planktothrix agardhii 1033]BBD53113.1 two-component response regulator [Planktothrix agardhii NIES-204]MCB8751442.1 winged helix-turn-helix domain-containing protein [Planktothrix agardhii 1810]MCB8751889.1 winged helix-turn-helix domain-containing protein [Planktothrix agardhii 1810]MCF3570635.1 winged helix-turn-helix domain-containing protein [Planktoth